MIYLLAFQISDKITFKETTKNILTASDSQGFADGGEKRSHVAEMRDFCYNCIVARKF